MYMLCTCTLHVQIILLGQYNKYLLSSHHPPELKFSMTETYQASA